MMAIAMQYGSHFFEWMHKRADGSEFPATVLLSRMELEGKPVLLATVRDVTRQKQAEERQARSLSRVQGVSRLQEDLLLPGPWNEKFQRITDAAVELLDLDFCRIWTVKPGDLCAGGCIHAAAADGCTAAAIATNACTWRPVRADTRTSTAATAASPSAVTRSGWLPPARRTSSSPTPSRPIRRSTTTSGRKSLGLVSFAGYKLRGDDGSPIGVLAMFAKHAISEEDDAFLSNLAEITSRVILESRGGRGPASRPAGRPRWPTPPRAASWPA